MDGCKLQDRWSPRDPVSALTHFIALTAAILACPPLLLHAGARGCRAEVLLGLMVFQLSMAGMYAASTVYHCYTGEEAGLLRRKKLDHAMIGVLIAGSYTPVCLSALWTGPGPGLLALVWLLAATGALFKLCWVTCPKWVSSVIYIAMGWSCVIAMPELVAALPKAGFGWLLAGGVFYTVGGVLYALKPRCLEGKLLGIHEIFHLFVMAGSVCHYLFMYGYIV